MQLTIKKSHQAIFIVLYGTGCKIKNKLYFSPIHDCISERRFFSLSYFKSESFSVSKSDLFKITYVHSFKKNNVCIWTLPKILSYETTRVRSSHLDKTKWCLENNAILLQHYEAMTNTAFRQHMHFLIGSKWYLIENDNKHKTFLKIKIIKE